MSDKIIGRVEKLVRIASSSSGATEAERANAALEVVRLIREHDLIVIERTISTKRARLPGEPAIWKSSTAARDSSCDVCGGSVTIGEKILVKSKGFDFKYAHSRCAIEK